VKGRVVLVGAGPGDPDLLTVRAAREIARAEVLLYDALIEPALLALAPDDCERIDVGKRGDGSRGFPQGEIADLMIARAGAGRHVVRLKGGDPFVFGRGGEEATALASAGIEFEVVPGISSAIGVPAYAGIPLTDRRMSSSFAVVTGHRGKAVVDERIDWEGLARSAETLVVLMGTAWLPDIVQRVIAGGRDPNTPAAVIERGTGPGQRVVVAPLHELAERVRVAGLRAPTVIVIGEVVSLRDALAWYEARPLFGRRVLVTRDAREGGEFAARLRARGATPVHVPLLAFLEPADPGPLERALEKIDQYDWLVFTSANGVRAVSRCLQRLGHSAADLATIGVACVGPKTEQAAREAGLRAPLVPSRGFLPEDLVEELARAATLSGSRILFPRAREGREALVDGLSEAGAIVETVEAYRTVLPEEAGAALRAAVEEGLDAVTLMSPSAVRHLAELLGSEDFRALARGAVFACIGPTTAAALRERGVDPGVVCKSSTAEALVEALEEYLGRRSHGISS
jgi:uroporphyrinogen III methyltransferase/synthase